ncbi:MAG: hypothetical protein GX654_07885 [Desulfatiglans sp.]|nr:hypothetical protein [Desulfatiglans sp.]
MIRAYREEALKIKGTKIPAKDKVEWGWQITIKNKTSRNIKVYIEYFLTDQDGFQVGYGNIFIDDARIPAGQTIILQEKATMPYENVKMVSKSFWKIEPFYE